MCVQAVGDRALGDLCVCVWCGAVQSQKYISVLIGSGTSVEVVSEEQKASLLDSSPCCWLMVNVRYARLRCMRVLVVKGKHSSRLWARNMIFPVRTIGKLKINQPVLWRSCTVQIRYSHSYKNSTPCGQTAGGDRVPRIYHESCVHIHIDTYRYILTYIYTYTYIYAYTRIYVFTYTHAYKFTHIYIYTCTYIHTYMYICTHIHIHTYTYIYTYTHTHTYW